MSLLTALTGLAMLVGLLGIAMPVLPGLLLILGATLAWAFYHPAPQAWLVFWVAVVLYVAGVAAQYLLPGRRMLRAGVGTGTLVLAVLAGVVGFFVVPVVGAVLGFVLAVFLVELVRHRDGSAAWASTRTALWAVLHSIGIELAAGFAIIVTWLAGLATLGQG
ncbi:MAG: DUF456 domain-containing protein [Dermatophilaceae bacterium]